MDKLFILINLKVLINLLKEIRNDAIELSILKEIIIKSKDISWEE